MKADDFTRQVRTRYVDGTEEIYREMFSRPLERFTDAAMLEMASFWQSSDAKTRTFLMKYLRLGSEASIARLLAVLDNTSSDFEEQFLLTARGRDGTVADLKYDLLDTFWAHAEKDVQTAIAADNSKT